MWARLLPVFAGKEKEHFEFCETVSGFDETAGIKSEGEFRTWFGQRAVAVAEAMRVSQNA